MSITATELKMNLGKYLMLAETEDVFITKNGKVIAKLTNPNADRVEMAKSLFPLMSPLKKPVTKGWIIYDRRNRHLCYH